MKDTALLSSLAHSSQATRLKKFKPHPLVFAIAMAGLGLPTGVMAGPQGGVVTGGAGTISQGNNTTTINQATDRLAIDWQSFDVAADERVQYIQPDSSSVALNRILSNRGSEIHGRIDANGQVILVNPNGVIFGENSVVNAGGILASGLSIDPADFMNGDLHFQALEGTDGLVINSGLLHAATGGSVSLLGKQVKNEGLISANLGTVNLAAGTEAIVTFDDLGLVGVQVTQAVLQEEIGVDPAILNSGEITAEQGNILISGSVSGDIFSQAVNSGLDHATSVVVHEDGSFTLGGGADVVNTGTLDVSGEQAGNIVVVGENVTSSGDVKADSSSRVNNAGFIEIHATDTTLITEDGAVTAQGEFAQGGDIKLLGNNVGLVQDAKVDASGATGGGQVLLGGDRTGANPQVRNAEFIFLGEETEINTDALDNGDGGRLITFASNTARIYGDLSATGGSSGGSGGFVETSGLIGFDILNAPDVSGINGNGGEWLIDPFNLGIVTQADSNSNGIPDLDIGDFDSIDQGAGNTLFQVFGDSLSTTNEPTALISIQTIQAALTGGVTVTIQTGGDITPDDNPLAVGNIVFAHSGNGVFAPTINFNNTGTNTLVLNAHNDIILNDRIIEDSSPNSSTAPGTNIDSLNLVFNAGFSNNQFGGSGDIGIFEDTVPNEFRNFNGRIETGGGDFTINANTVEFGVSIDTGGGALRINDANSVSFQNNVNTGSGDLIITASGDVTHSRGGSIVVGGLTSINTNFDANDTAGDITFDFSSDNDFNAIRIVDANTVSITDTNEIVFGDNALTQQTASRIRGSFTLQTSGNINQAALNHLDVDGLIDIDSNGGDVNLTDINNIFDQAVSIDTSDNGVSGIPGNNPGGSIDLRAQSVVVGDIDASDNTGAGTISITVADSFITTDSSILHADGDDENDLRTITINGTDAANTFTFDDANALDWIGSSLSINGLGENDTFNINTSLGAANINAGAGDDNFVISDTGQISGFIDAGEGTLDTLNVSAITSGVLVEIATDNSGVTHVDPEDSDATPSINVHVNNFESLIAADDGDPASGAENNNWLAVNLTDNLSWSITDRNQGSISFSDDASVPSISFDNFGVLIGGAGNDGFGVTAGATISHFVNPQGGNVFGSFSGDVFTIGVDTLPTNEFLPFVSGVTISGLVSDGTGELRISDDPADSTDSWISTWTITGENDGTYTNNLAVDDADFLSFSFFDFNVLTGGDGTDNFVFGDTGSITGSINGNGGTNSITGRNINSTWTIAASNSGSIATTDDPATTYLANFSNIQQLVGGTANDQFLIGANIGTAGDAIADILGGEGSDEFVLQVEDLGFEINAGENTDDLDVIRGVDGSLITNAWMLDQLEGGTVTNDSDELDGFDATVSFSNIETVQGGGEFDFNDGNGSVGGVDEFTLSADFGTGTLVEGLSGADTFTVTADQAGGLQGGAGNDTFNLSASVTGGVQGNNGDDLFEIRNSSISVNILGGDGVSLDTISLVDTDTADDSSWVIDSNDGGSLNGFITFDTINAIQGADNGDPNSEVAGENDRFQLNESFAGSIDARGGVDSVLFTDSTNPITFSFSEGLGVSNAEALETNGAENGADFILRLTGSSAGEDFRWSIDGVNNGSIQLLDSEGNEINSVSFINFGNLEGGNANDTFTIADGSSIVSVDGNFGTLVSDEVNALIYESAGADVWRLTSAFGGDINFDSNASTQDLTFADIQSIQGDATSADSLQGPDRVNLWILDDEHSVGLQIDETTQTDRLVFSNIADLIGGSESDRFNVIQTFNGSLEGRAGQDFFNLGADVTGNVLGGSSADSFDINALVTGVVNGQAGNDQFFIAASANDLRGGDNDDDFFIEALGITVSITGSDDDVSMGSTGDRIIALDHDGTNIWNTTAVRAGNLNIDTVANTGVTFENIENYTGGSGIDEFNLTNSTTIVFGEAGADIFNINSSITSSLNGGEGNDEFNLTSDVTGAVNGDAGQDTFNLLANSYSASLAGGDDADTFVINVSNTTVNIIGGESVSDGASQDLDLVRLDVDHGENAWMINTLTNSGNLDGSVMFSEVERIEGADQGGSPNADDSFEFIGSSSDFGDGLIGGGIDARGGSDSVLVSAIGIYDISLTGSLQGISNVENIENITNEGAEFTLRIVSTDDDADAGANFVWNITGVNDGVVSNAADPTQFVSFTNFTNLVGNEANDQFVLNSGSSIGSVSGVNVGENLVPNERNTLQTVAGDNIWRVTGRLSGVLEFENTPSDADNRINIGFENINSFNGGVGIDQIIGRTDQNNTWTIETVENELVQTLSQTINEPDDTIFFNGIDRLTGLAGVDTFNVNADFSGVLEGGGNNDVFNLNANVIDLDQPAVRGQGGDDIFNINADVTGGINGNAGDDDFFISADVSGEIDGGQNDDEFFILQPVNISRITGNEDNDTVLLDYVLNTVWTIDGFTETAVSTDNSGPAAIDNTINFLLVENINGVNAGVLGDGVTPVSETFNIAVDDPINANTAVTNINGREGDDIFNVTQAFTGDLLGGLGADTFNIDATVTGAIEGGAGNDAFDLFAQVTGNIEGGAGNDQFNIENLSFVQTIHGDDADDAAIVGDDTVTLADAAVDATWQLDTENSGSLHVTGATDPSIQFSDVENLNGSDGGNDRFVFNFDGEFEGTVDARGGSFNAVDVFGDNVNVVLGQTVNGVNNAQVVQGNGDISVLSITGGTSANPTIWSIEDFDAGNALANGVNDGTISSLADDGVTTNTLSFVDFGVLQGNAANDQFTVTNGSSLVSVNGNSGAQGANEVNTLAYETASDNVWRLTSITGGDINFDSNASTQDLRFSNVQSLIGSGNDTLIGSNNLNTWTFDTDVNGGNRIESGGNAIAFSGMSALTGGTLEDTFNINNLVSIIIDGASGDDHFIFGESGQASDISGGEGVDIITARNAVNTWITDAEGAGRIGLTPADPDPFDPYASFTEIEVLQGGSLVDTFNLAHNFTSIFGSNGADIFNILEDLTADLFGNSGTDTFNIDFVVTGAISGGTQNDTFNLAANVTGLIEGDDGNDEFNIENPLLTFNLHGDDAAGNFNGTDTLNLQDTATNVTWVIDGVESGRLEANVQFQEFENIEGSDGGDDRFQFVIPGGAEFAGSIDARGGTDIVDLSNANAPANLTISSTDTLFGVSNVETAIGQGNLSTLTIAGSDGFTTQWTITDFGDDQNLADGSNDGVVTLINNSDNSENLFINFINFANLTGGDQADSFLINLDGSISGTINGAGGSNTLTTTVDNRTWMLEDTPFQGSVTDVVSLFQNIQSLVGSGSDQLIAPNLVNTWTIDTAVNGGNRIETDGNIIRFAQMGTLTGGSNTDTFIVNTEFAGGINGGAGVVADQFDLNANVSGPVNGDAGNDLFNINTTVAGALIGGLGNDAFVLGAAGVALNIDGGADTDSITARDLDNRWITDADGAGRIGLFESDPLDVIAYADFTNVETLQGGSQNDTFDIGNDFTSIAGGAGNDTFNVNALVSGSISGGNGDDTFIMNANVLGGIAGNAGADRFELLTNSITADILGGADGDTFVIGAPNITANIFGNSGTDTVSLETDHGENLWTFTNNNSGNLDSTLVFTEIEQILGSDTEADIFRFNSNFEFGDLVDGRGGDDVVDLSMVASDITITPGQVINGVINANTVLGDGTGTITVAGVTSATLWQVVDFDGDGDLADGTNDGVIGGVTNFIDFANLTGSNQTDNFEITSTGFISGVINGAGGSNSLESDSAGGIWNLSSTPFQGDLVGRVDQFQNIQILTGSGSDTLVAPNLTNTWIIRDAIDGASSLEFAGSSVSFTGMNTLSGGSLVDQFNFNGVFNGSVNGGEASDEFNFSGGGSVASIDGGIDLEGTDVDVIVGQDVDSIWSIDNLGVNSVAIESSGEEYLSSFTNIERLEGSDVAIDQFDFYSNVSTIAVNGGLSDGDIANFATVGVGPVNITLGDSTNLFGIQRVIGNNNATLFFDRNSPLIWTISDFSDTIAGVDGINDGRVAGIEFVDVNNLQGGSNVDTFQLISTITGTIDGQNGADIYEVINRGASANISDTGTTGSDQLTLEFDDAGVERNDWIVDGVDSRIDFIVQTVAGDLSSEVIDNTLFFGGIENLIGNSSTDNVLVTNNIASVNSIETRGGDDIVDIFASLPDLNTGAGNDVIIVSQAGADVNVSGGGGDRDVLLLEYVASRSDWTIDAENGGSVNAINIDGNNVETQLGTVSFDGIDVVGGGQHADNVTVTAGISEINTRGGEDIISIESSVISTNVIGGNGLGNDRLQVNYTDIVRSSEWTIDGNNRVVATTGANSFGVVTFEGIEEAVGGSGVDTFNVSDVFGFIDAGASGDIINLNEGADLLQGLDAGTGQDEILIATNITGVISGNNGSDTFSVTSADAISFTIEGGNAGAPGDTLVSSDNRTLNNWVIGGSGADSNTLNSNARFSGIENYVGSSADDNFRLVSGSILSVDGMGGINSLEIEHTNTVNWTINGLNSGFADGVNQFSNIQNLIGGVGRDVFSFAGDPTISNISGIINGGEPTDLANPESQIDEINLDLFQDGVVLIVNGASSQGVDFTRLSLDSGFNGFGDLPNIQVENIEQANARAGTDASERNNWLIADTLAALNWTSTDTNQGFYYQQPSEDDTTEILNTRVNFNNFGNIRGGDGLDQLNGFDNEALSGDFFLSLGISILDLSDTNGLVVVDIDENTVSVIGNEGTAGNRTLIRIADRSNNLLNGSDITNDWLIDGDASGSLVSSFDTDFTFTFSGVTDIQGGDGVDNFSLTGTGFLSGSIDGDGGLNTISAMNSAVNQLNFGISELVNLPSQIGDVDILEDRLNVIDIANISELTSNGLDSTLFSGSQHENYNWSIGDQNTLSYERNAQIETLTFDGVNNLAGSDSVDVFTILNVTGDGAIIGVDGSITGGGNSDTIDLTALDQDVSVFLSTDANATVDLRIDEIEILTANRNSDLSNTIFGANNNNTWTIGTATQSINAGSVDGTSFDGFANLIGGTANDTFIFDGVDTITGFVDGGSNPAIGSAQDRVDLTGANRDVIVTLDSNAEVGEISVTRIEQIDANISGVFSNRIIASSTQANTWTIEQINGGRITDTSNVSDQVVGFTGFANLTGGASEDRFEIDGNSAGAVTGVISGGGATDTLSISNDFNGVVVSTDLNDVSQAGVDFVVADIESLLVTNTNESLNELRAGDTANRWTIGASINGTFDSENAGRLNDLTFSGIANLVGGANEDIFVASFDGAAANPVNARVTGVIDGGANENDVQDQLSLGNLPLGNNLSVSLNQASGADYFIRDIESVSANSANDNRLIAANTETLWQISGQSQGSIVNELDFFGFNDLQGSGQVDRFVILATDGIDINTDQIFMNIDGMGGDDQLVAADGRVNNWEFDVVDGLNRNQDDSLGVFFTSIENYTGGNGSDIFAIISGNVNGQIDGGAGNDSLEVISDLNQTIDWEISDANQGRVARNNTQIVSNGFQSIENLDGGDGVDNFVFTTANGSLSGLIDGGESRNGDQEVVDTLDVRVFTTGVRVEVGDNPNLGLAGSVNIHNLEQATAAPGSGEAEALNWLAITGGADVQWNINSLNQGWVQEVEDALVTPLVPIEGTRLNFDNFGSLDSGSGASSSNIQDDDLSGDFIAGLGGTSLDFSGRDGLVVITLFDNVLSVTGNGNTLLQVDEASTSLNGINEWTIFAENAGTLLTSGGDEPTVVEFNSVNQLRGGSGDDLFLFTTNETADGTMTTGSLVNGSIDGGISGNDLVTTAAISGDMVFGVNDLVLEPVVASNDPQIVIDGISIVDNREGILDLLRIDILETNANATNTLYSSDQFAYEWNVGQPGIANTLTGNGNSLAFSGVTQLVGGMGSDTFNILSFEGLVTRIDAGSNATNSDIDVLNLTAINDALTVSLNENLTGENIFNVANFEQLQLNQNVDNNLVAAEQNNVWTLDRVNGGRLNAMEFDGVNSLTGGTLDDVFTINDSGFITGLIDGGSSDTGNDIFNFVDKTVDVVVSFDIDAVADFYIANVNDILGSELSNTLIASNTQNNIWTIDGINSGDLNGITFANIENLTGASSIDEFILDGNDQITGLIDGGRDDIDFPVTDILDISGLNENVTVSLETSNNTADINISRIDLVNGNAVNTNTLVAQNNGLNIWQINGTNAGNVSDVEFVGFANLIGGSGNDNFIFDLNDEITGIIDGGVEVVGDSSQDLVDITALGRQTTVSLDSNFDADINIVNIESVSANSAIANTLIGYAENSVWQIQRENSGSIENQANPIETTSFDGFGNLQGRNNVDRFAFSEFGSLTGSLDGGAQPEGLFDSVDMSQLAQVRISIGNNDQDFQDIEEFIGNNTDSIITADDIENTWTLTEGQNQGLLNNEISFVGFNVLEGGNQEDHFVVNGGSLSNGGELRGGAGDDDLELTISEGNSGQVIFDGQTGNDSVLIAGGSDLFTANHQINALGDSQVEYVAQNPALGDTRYNLTYQGTETIRDEATANQLVIRSSSDQIDIVNLLNMEFSINDQVGVNYIGKQNLRVAAQTEDQVVVDGNLVINSEFAVEGASVNGVNNARINASRVSFTGNQSVGQSDNRLALNATSLSIEDVLGDVYLSELNAITLASLSNINSLVDIVAVETIDSSAALFSDGTVNLTSEIGDILLENGNGFTGQLNLAANVVSVTNNTTTELGQVNANQLNVITNGNLLDGEQGVVNVSGTTTINASNNNVLLDNALNDFNVVDIVAARDVTVIDNNSIFVQGNVDNLFDVRASQELTVSDLVQAANVNFESGAQMFVRFAIDANESINLSGQGIDVDANVAVNNALQEDTITINGGLDPININSIVSSENSLGAAAGNITINGDGINLAVLGDIVGGSLNLESISDVNLAGQINLVNNLSSNVSAGTFTMADTGVINANAIDVFAADSIVLGSLNLASINAQSNANIQLTDNTELADSAVFNAGGNFEMLSDVNLTAQNGNITVTAANEVNLESITTNVGSISVSGNNLVDINGPVNSAGNLTISAESGSIFQRDSVTTGGETSYESGQEILMDAIATIDSAQDLTLIAGTDISVATINAGDSTVSLNSMAGSIVDNNDREDVNGSVSETNIVANRLEIVSGTGIGGASDAFELSVAEIDAVNQTGAVFIENNQELVVNAIKSNGDIDIQLTEGDLILFDPDATDFINDRTAFTPEYDATQTGGIVNANYLSGDVTIILDDGDVRTNSPLNIVRPEITGRVVQVGAPNGAIGVQRPLVIFASDIIRFNAQSALLPVNGFGVEPLNGFEGGETGIIDLSELLSASNELLVELESLEEIDPAVFTEVRNYSFENISIRMPRDQLFEDEDESDLEESEI